MLDPLLERREGSGEREGGEWRERGRERGNNAMYNYYMSKT